MNLFAQHDPWCPSWGGAKCRNPIVDHYRFSNLTIPGYEHHVSTGNSAFNDPVDFPITTLALGVIAVEGIL